MRSKSSVAKQFGEYLDEDNFEQFKLLLSVDCNYEIGGQVLNTPETIAGLYEQNLKEGKEKFDELIWGKSRVEQVSENQFDIFFSDFLKHKGVTHNYKCKQRILINADGLVEEIIHLELPGEKEALQRYYEQVGLSKK